MNDDDRCYGELMGKGCSQRAVAERLAEKANDLARLVEQLAYAPVAGYYERQGNPAPLQLLRLAVEEVDELTKKGGAR